MKRAALLICVFMALVMGSAQAAKPASYDQSPFGVNYLKWEFLWNKPGWEDEIHARARNMKEIGVYWDRDGISRGSVNPSDDGKTWVWDKPDKLVQICKDEGINLVVILMGNPTPRDEATRRMYAEYTYQVVNRYKDYVKIWEIWNEPNIPSFWKNPDAKLYTELLKAMYTAAKKADPTCTVVAGSSNGPGNDWFDAIYNNGGWNYCDGISIHPYAMASNPIEQGLDRELAYLNKQIAKLGKKPIWSTEVGWKGKKGADEEIQATKIIQTYIIHIANGFQNMDYFCMDNYDDWGFVMRTSPPETKLAYGSIKLITQALGSPGPCAKFQGYLQMPEGVACYVFAKPKNQRVLVLWSNNKQTHNVQLAQKSGLSAVDIINKPVQVTSGSLDVGPTPIIVTGADARKIGKVSMDFNPYLRKPGQNLLVNPGMDADPGKNPHGWTEGRFFHGDKDGKLATTNEGRNGSTCVSISESGKSCAWDASPIPVDPDKTYTLTAWIKTKDATGKNVVGLYWYSGNQWTCMGAPSTQTITGTQDWTMVTVTAKPPRGAAIVRVNLVSENNKGTTWFDDVSLTEN